MFVIGFIYHFPTGRQPIAKPNCDIAIWCGYQLFSGDDGESLTE
jgi:hypothetical protein